MYWRVIDGYEMSGMSIVRWRRQISELEQTMLISTSSDLSKVTSQFHQGARRNRNISDFARAVYLIPRQPGYSDQHECHVAKPSIRLLSHHLFAPFSPIARKPLASVPHSHHRISR